MVPSVRVAPAWVARGGLQRTSATPRDASGQILVKHQARRQRPVMRHPSSPSLPQSPPPLSSGRAACFGFSIESRRAYMTTAAASSAPVGDLTVEAVLPEANADTNASGAALKEVYAPITYTFADVDAARGGTEVTQQAVTVRPQPLNLDPAFSPHHLPVFPNVHTPIPLLSTLSTIMS